MKVIKCDRKCQSNVNGYCLGMPCFLGKEIEESVDYLIIHINHEQYVAIVTNREPKGLFYQIKDGKYICVDNRTGDAWVDVFESRKEAFDWLQREIEEDERL